MRTHRIAVFAACWRAAVLAGGSAAAPRRRRAAREQHAAAGAAGRATLVLRGGRIVTVDEARPEAQAIAVHRRHDRCGRVESGDPAVHRRRHARDRSQGRARGARVHRCARAFHRRRRGCTEPEARRRRRTGTRSSAWWAKRRRRRGPANGSSAAAGIRRNGRELPSPNVEGFPVHDALSRVSPDNPVWLTHASGHAGFANALAMKMAEVTKTTPDPAGGKILQDKDGNPTGLFNERAQSLIGDALARDRATRHAGAGRGRPAQGDRAGGAGEPLERAHDGERRRLAAVDHRGDEEGRGRTQAAAARLDDDARNARQAGQRPAEVPHRQLRRQAVHRARNQARRRRRARLARRLAARALRRHAVHERVQHRFARGHPADRGTGDQVRLSAGRPRDRRPWQPRRC